MTHYYLSNDTGKILAKTEDETAARQLGPVLAKDNGPVALHAVITMRPAPIGGSVSMVGIMDWFCQK